MKPTKSDGARVYLNYGGVRSILMAADSNALCNLNRGACCCVFGLSPMQIDVRIAHVICEERLSFTRYEKQSK